MTSDQAARLQRHSDDIRRRHEAMQEALREVTAASIAGLTPDEVLERVQRLHRVTWEWREAVAAAMASAREVDGERHEPAV